MIVVFLYAIVIVLNVIVVFLDRIVIFLYMGCNFQAITQMKDSMYNKLHEITAIVKGL